MWGREGRERYRGEGERKKREEEEAKTSLLRWEERSEVGGTCLLKGPLHSGTACHSRVETVPMGQGQSVPGY